MTNNARDTQGAPTGAAAYVAPRADTERALQEIWSAVLKASRIGLHDDFLDLGGDSLAAMRCNNRVRARFGVELPLELYFLEPADIAELASHLDRMLRDEP